ncbi:MAG: urate hydroxylase PuuD [Woeseiaceae bacterium]
MEAYLIEWLSLLGRWLHFIVGVAWIGSSFYFVWLDNHLLAPKLPEDDQKGVGGEVWSVHGGGFYHAQKYRVAPSTIPDPLHWFKWEAYTTWMSGMFLLALIYWYGAEIYLIDTQIADLSPFKAVAIGAAYIVGGWLVYDGLCRSPIGKNDNVLALFVFALLIVAAYTLCHLFSGRGAYIHFGALIGTIMVANVFFIIIPGQKRMVAAAESGAPVDPTDGIRAKQRSVHNTYFTLPILFVMISNHYAMTYGHKYNWLILIAMLVVGALIRVFFVARHKGKASPLPLVLAIVILAVTAAAIAPQPRTQGTSEHASSTPLIDIDADFSDVIGIVRLRCATCHANEPTQPGFLSPPGGVVLYDESDIIRQAERIYQQSVISRIMPVGNLTGMQDRERSILGAWFESGASEDWTYKTGEGSKP